MLIAICFINKNLTPLTSISFYFYHHKNMKRYIITFYSLFILFVCLPLGLQAQMETANWLHKGHLLNFTSNTTIPVIQALPTTINSLSFGSTSISDKDGKLLFYSDGRNIYNAQHQVIENGTDLRGCAAKNYCLSTYQSVLIVPYPASKYLYYLFQNGTEGEGLWYSIIDMSLNNGRGKVLQKNIRLRDRAGTGLAATIGIDCKSYWLLNNDWVRTGYYYAYKITATGIESPVISIHSTESNQDFMQIIFSQQGNKVSTHEDGTLTSPKGTCIYDFNLQTGVLSNQIIINPNRFTSPMGFSPDGNLFYAGGHSGTTNGVLQFDLSSNNTNQINASMALLKDTGNKNADWGFLTPAINGKLYFFEWNDSYSSSKVDVIHQPNVKGTACRYETQVFEIPPSPIPMLYRSHLQFPQFPSNFIGGVSKDFTFSQICNSLAVKFSATSPSRNESYAWNFGDGSTSTAQNPTKTYAQAGNYTVTVKIGACTFTKNVTVQPIAKITLPDSIVLCANESRSIGILPQTGFSYQWTPQTGLSASNIANPTLRLANTTDSTRKITYKLVVTNIANGCKDSALLPIKVRPALPAISAGKDTTVCSGQTIVLGTKPTITPPSGGGGATLTYLWTPQTGLSATNTAQPTLSLVNTTTQPQKFTYILQATQANCTVQDTVVVTVLPSMQPKIIGATAVCPFAQRMSYRLQTVGKSATLQWQVIGGTILNSSTPAGTGGLWLDSIVVNWQGENPKAMVKVWTINEFECIDSMTLNIKINPQAPALADFGGANRKICYGQTVMIGKPTLPQHSYQWSFSAAQGFSALSTNLSSIPILNTNTSGQIIMTNAFVTVKNNATGCEYRDTVQLQLYPQLQVEAGKDTVVCSGTTLRLGIKPLPNAANYRYQWQPALFLDNPQLAQPTAKFVNTTTTAQVLDYELVVSWDSCQVVDKVRITILPQLPLYKVKGTAFVCPNVQQIGYKLDSVPANSGVKIRWVVRGGNFSLTDKTDSIHVNWGSTNTNAEVVAIVQAVTGCVDSFKLAVKVLPELRPALPIGNTKICWTADNLQTYTTNFTNGSVYEWHVEGGTLQSPQGKNSMAVRWNGVGQHRIWVTENSTTRTDICRGTSEKLTVNVLPTPLPKTIVGLTEICENEVQTTYRYDSEKSSTYVWEVQGGEIVSGQGTQEIVVSWKNATQNALVKVQETNTSGCKGQVQQQTVRINSTENCLVIPSLVSVGDAHFPYWHIKNIEKYPNNGLVVYNSLGQVVIQQNGYQNNYPLTHLSAGIYYYRLWVLSGERKISYSGKMVVLK